PYHGGESELFVGKILKKYDRESLYLATKLPIWDVNTLDDAKRLFNEQLTKLDVEYVDFYLIHALDKNRWKKVLELNILDYLDELVKEGKIRNLGFSFHDDYEVFEEILKYRKWDFCQIQYNYIDTDIQAGDKGYELSVKLGVPLVIMEPVKGGVLAMLPEDVTAPLKEIRPEASTASWALRWVANHDNVKVILSGMSSYEQVMDNLKTFEKFEPLTDEEEAAIKGVVDTINSRTRNGCTGCRYCMPCPFGVDIPRAFSIWNEYGKYGNERKAVKRYFDETPAEKLADVCQKCGACEAECPQHLNIRDDLDRLHEELLKLKESK
ncbi:MAG: aldo/keto reductase, partial [Lachnospiraceae bacterium]|nr:aldo/keto reductase [Lachnospiraceae bacterium]